MLKYLTIREEIFHDPKSEVIKLEVFLKLEMILQYIVDENKCSQMNNFYWTGKRHKEARWQLGPNDQI